MLVGRWCSEYDFLLLYLHSLSLQIGRISFRVKSLGFIDLAQTTLRLQLSFLSYSFGIILSNSESLFAKPATDSMHCEQRIHCILNVPACEVF